MQFMKTRIGSEDEKGVTLIEQVMAALFIGFLILVWVNSIRVTTRGTIQSKNNLRAQNLALSKVEDVKNTIIKASYASTFSSVSNSALVTAYLTPQVSTIENKSFTWRVLTNYAVWSSTPTASALPTPVTYSTYNLWIRAEVFWQDVTGPKQVTMTGYATDYRQ